MKNEITQSASLVEEFGEEVKENRRERNHSAAKSMTRTMLLVAVFCFAVLVRFWIT